MKKMKTKSVRFLKSLAVICLLGLLLMSVAGCKDSVYDEDRFAVELSYGYGNNLEIDAYAPFYVDVTNQGANFEGSVQMIVPGRNNNNIMYEKEISIQQGATKRVELVGFIEILTRQVNIRILNSNGKVIWEKLQNCSTLTDVRKVNVGILSDDYPALGYMDHKPFTSYSSLTTQIYELKADTFPSDWHALEMLDVLVVSDFSTDLLSDAQIGAISIWVNNGGLLMVGTGSTGNKTLAKLNGNLFNVTTEGLKTYQTKFGLTIADYDYDYVDNNTYYYSPYDDYEYEMFFEENFELIRSELETMYLEDFCDDYGYSEDTDTWSSYMEDDFYYFCFYEFYQEYLKFSEDYQGDTYSEISGFSYVKADVLQMSVSGEEYGQTIYGEEESGKTYDLAYVLTKGDGYVLLSGVDFTKTPLSNFDGNDELFIHWVESLIGEKCYEDSESYSDYQYGYYSSGYNYQSIDYYERDIFEGVDSATVPPLLIYFGILFLYVVSILVLYLIMRSKKKTMRLWIVYPAVAVGLSILIFCIGFSTRIHRPIINAVTLLSPDGSSINQRTYASVTVPRNKEYTIGFNPEQGVEYVINRSSYYFDEDEIDLSKFTYGYKYGYDSTDIRLGDIEAMGSAHFKMSAVSADGRTVNFEMAEPGFASIISSSGRPNITVTNRFGCKLENAALIVDGSLYYIGDMENGQSVSGNAMQPEELYYDIYGDGLGAGVMKDESGMTVLGYLFGSINGSYDEYLCKLRTLNSLSDFCDRNNDIVTFIAFPTDEIAGELQGNTKYNERRTELIYIEIDKKEFVQRYQN